MTEICYVGPFKSQYIFTDKTNFVDSYNNTIFGNWKFFLLFIKYREK